MHMTIAETVRVAREASEMTQFELAVRAGVSLATIYRIEAGRVAPTPATLAVLSTSLGVDLTHHKSEADTASTTHGKPPATRSTAKKKRRRDAQGA